VYSEIRESFVSPEVEHDQKLSMQAPGRLIAEEPSLRDGGGDFCHERNMVGGVPIGGGKNRGRKRIVPSLVDKNPV
jgi:hypothetical protein